MFTPTRKRSLVGPRPFRPVMEVLEDRWVPAAGLYTQTNLASSEPGVALIHDPELVNAWGISLNQGGGAFWVSAHGTGVSTLYTGDIPGRPFAKAFTVTIPGGAPTGQVFNAASPDFAVPPGGTPSLPAIFIFAGETGAITGWNPGVPGGARLAQVGVPGNPEVVYTGLAQASNAGANFLYAADFANRSIDVFDRTFTPFTPAGSFVDPGIGKHYAPFNIQNLGGKLFVTYAKQEKDGGLAPGGNGFVSVFDTAGNFERRFASHGPLHAPWGLALAPADFGAFSNAVLVGNHNSGRIQAFDAATGDHLGVLRNELGQPISIDGLFGLAFGNGVSAGDRNALYFAAGPDGGQDGLFGSLRVAETETSAARAATSAATVQAAFASSSDTPGDVGDGLAEVFGIVLRGAAPERGVIAAGPGVDSSAAQAPPAAPPDQGSSGPVSSTTEGVTGGAPAAVDAFFALAAPLGDDPFTALW